MSFGLTKDTPVAFSVSNGICLGIMKRPIFISTQNVTLLRAECSAGSRLTLLSRPINTDVVLKFFLVHFFYLDIITNVIPVR